MVDSGGPLLSETQWFALMVWLAAVNVIAFVAFAVDKMAARRGTRRIPEDWLIGLAILGGWVGAKAGQQVFRHKTRAQPFASRLNRVPLVLLAIGASASVVLMLKP